MKGAKRQEHDAEWYLADPRTRRWMIQCHRCMRWGYQADAPATFFGRSALVRHFEPIKSDGVCEQCRGV